MRAARGWWLATLVLTTAFACTLPSVDEYARSGPTDAGAAADASAVSEDATTVTPDASAIVPYLRVDPPARTVVGADLTGSGPLDWVQWQTPTERCASCPRLFGAIEAAAPVTSYTDDIRTWSWTNGTPDRAGSASAGIFIDHVGSAFVLPVLLPDTPVVLTLHGDVYHSAGRLDLALDGLDAGTPPSVSVPVDVYGYVFVVHAHGPGRTLHLTWTMTSGATADANLAVAAVTLAPE